MQNAGDEADESATNVMRCCLREANLGDDEG
jgi:hypothetical protein